MGIVHPGSELVPTKHELLSAWLPTQDWWPTVVPVAEFIANFRFDDPAGEVGIETFLFPLPDARVVQVPVTYRSAPLDGGTLVGEMEHSALGRRWVYDGPSDPVYVAETTAVIREGRSEVTMLNPDGSPIARRPFTASVRGSGDGAGALDVVRILRCDETPGIGTLTATWSGQVEPLVLARLI